MKLFIPLGLVLLAGVAVVQANPAESAREDLRAAQQRLVQIRETIATEKPLLANRFNDVQFKLLESRRKVRIARMAEVDRKELLKALEKKHHLFQQDHLFVTGKLSDYGLSFETFLFPGEEEVYEHALRGIRANSDDPRTLLEKRLAMLEAGIDRLEKVIGGTSFIGEAVAPDGGVKRGTFALAGPSAWFIAEDNS